MQLRLKTNVLQLLSCLILTAVLFPSLLRAGGPENVLLVVNADSASSKMIANHYISLRKIPSQNVVYIQGIKDSERTSVDEFKKRILKPVLKAMETRKLINSVDYIVYSSDFPTAINTAVHWKKLQARYQELPDDKKPDRRVFIPMASINSLTFFAGAVLADEPTYMLLDSNNYYRKPASLLLRRPFHGPLQETFESALKTLEGGTQEERKVSIATLEGLAQQNPAQLAVAYHLARFYAQEEDALRATAWLKRSVRLGWSYRKQTQADTAFDPVGQDEEFKEVVSKIPDLPFDFAPTIGFRSQFSFGANGMINSVPGQGNRHFLSTVLAVTRNHGNTEREALDQLQRSIRADGSLPDGTFFLAETDDIRSKTRQPQFASTIKALGKLGYKTEVCTTKVPVRERRVLGVSSGTPVFNWTQTGSRLVPGAIGDNFTSFGGRMDFAGQTKLSEFIRHGAAGASGTVIEPYAIPNKFPHTLIHAHYARGCTLAESYYQSVAGPTQLLIVGDALCRPFSRLPTIEVSGLKPDDTIKGSVSVGFNTEKSPVPVGSIELFIDGRRVHRQTGSRSFKLDTTGLSDGYHEFRVIAVQAGLIGATGNKIIPVKVNNHGRNIELSCQHQDYLDTDTIRFSAKSNWGDEIGILQNGRMIARKQGRDVKFSIPAVTLGRGPVKLEALSISEDSDAVNRTIASFPVSLEIEGRLSKLRRDTNPPKERKRPERKK